MVNEFPRRNTKSRLGVKVIRDKNSAAVPKSEEKQKSELAAPRAPPRQGISVPKIPTDRHMKKEVRARPRFEEKQPDSGISFQKMQCLLTGIPRTPGRFGRFPKWSIWRWTVLQSSENGNRRKRPGVLGTPVFRLVPMTQISGFFLNRAPQGNFFAGGCFGTLQDGPSPDAPRRKPPKTAWCSRNPG